VLQPGDWDYVLVSRLGDFPDQALQNPEKPEVLEFKPAMCGSEPVASDMRL
jgi:hypothetical protein